MCLFTQGNHKSPTQLKKTLHGSAVGAFKMLASVACVLISSLSHATESPNSTVQASSQLLARERGPASTHAPSKPEIIEALRQIQSRQLQVITNVDSQIKRLLQESTELSLKGRDLSSARLKLTKITDSLNALKNRREEYSSRRQFIDQLILIVDSKWTGQPLHEFLSGQLLDMAITDLTSHGDGSRTSTFLVYLSIALRELPERRESTIAFIESYLNFAGILEPKSPVDFISSRSYSNGEISVSAKGVDKKDLGDLVDKRLRELGLEKGGKSGKVAAEGRQKQRQSIQLRMKAPIPSESAESADKDSQSNVQSDVQNDTQNISPNARGRSENRDQNPNSAVRNSSM